MSDFTFFMPMIPTNAEKAGPSFPSSQISSMPIVTLKKRRRLATSTGRQDLRSFTTTSISQLESRFGRRLTLIEQQLLNELDTLRASMVESNVLTMGHIARLEAMLSDITGTADKRKGDDHQQRPAVRRSELSQESLMLHNLMMMESVNPRPRGIPNKFQPTQNRGFNTDYDNDNESEYTCSLCLSHYAHGHSIDDAESIEDNDAHSYESAESLSTLDLQHHRIVENENENENEDDEFLLVLSPNMSELEEVGGDWLSVASLEEESGVASLQDVGRGISVTAPDARPCRLDWEPRQAVWQSVSNASSTTTDEGVILPVSKLEPNSRGRSKSESSVDTSRFQVYEFRSLKVKSAAAPRLSLVEEVETD